MGRLHLRGGTSAPTPPDPPTTEYRFPKFTNVIDVTDYGATGNGVTDDTAAIQAAITASRTLGDPSWRAIYFPDGTYLVSDRLQRGTTNDWDNHFWIQGESETGTIIKLKDNCSGYTNASSPKAVIYQTSGASGAYAGGWETYGNGADGYKNMVHDITIDLGTGNVGAIGIDLLANNIGGVRRVTVDGLDGGYAGVANTREGLGPCLAHRLTVKGCRYGLDLRGRWYSLTAEHVHLEDQSIAGISIEHQYLVIRGLTSQNSVPVVDIKPGNVVSTIVPTNSLPFNGGSSMAGLCLLEGNFSGGSGSVSAIQNRSPDGKVFLRDVTATGYRAVLDEGSTPSAWSPTLEYATPPVHSKYRTTADVKSLRLTIRETPEMPYPELADVTYAPAPTGSDDTALIQNAIDNCATACLVFPTYHYKFNGAGQTIHIRGDVDYLLFNNSRFEITGGGYSASKYVWRIEKPVYIEHIGHENWQLGQYWWQNASFGDVVFKSCYMTGYTNVSGTLGDVFFDDVLVSGSSHPYTQNLYGRQFNAECAEQSKTNSGDWWILGWKDECYTTPLTITAGRAEVFGFFGSHQSLDVSFGTKPAFVVTNAALALVGLSASFNYTYQYWVNETQSPDAVRYLMDSELQMRGTGGRWVSLFRSKL